MVFPSLYISSIKKNRTILKESSTYFDRSHYDVNTMALPNNLFFGDYVFTIKTTQMSVPFDDRIHLHPIPGFGFLFPHLWRGGLASFPHELEPCPGQFIPLPGRTSGETRVSGHSRQDACVRRRYARAVLGSDHDRRSLLPFPSRCTGHRRAFIPIGCKPGSVPAP